jgi:hypothetical protein
MADVVHRYVIGQPGERIDSDPAAVIADRAREEEREAERSDLAEQHRRERIATHAGEPRPLREQCPKLCA